MNWSDMSYDERRALLGLADVKHQVAVAQFVRAVRGASAALRRLGEAWASASRPHKPGDFTLAGEK